MGTSFPLVVLIWLGNRRNLITCVIVCGLYTGCTIKGEASDHNRVTQDSVSKHPVTVADVIRMRHLASDTIAYFCPDGTKFVLVLRSGNLEQNTNDYSMLLWRTNEVFNTSSPETLLTFSSSSNTEAIKNLSWFSDNETLAFLGEQPGEVQQLYTINVRTYLLKRLTRHPTNILSYSLSSTNDRLVFVAEQPVEQLFNEKAKREGYVVSTEWLSDLISNKKGGWVGENQLFFGAIGHDNRRLNIRGRINPWSTPHLSPDGRYILVSTQVANIPDRWKAYATSKLQPYLK